MDWLAWLAFTGRCFGFQIVRDLPSNRRIALWAEESGGDCAGASYRTYVRKSTNT